jgi:Mce-associated membrane protein
MSDTDVSDTEGLVRAEEPEAAEPSERRRVRLLPAVLAILVVLAAGAVTWLAVLHQSASDEDAAGDAAIVAARQMVTDLVTTDPETAEASFERLQQSATGQFAEQLAQQSGSFAQIVKSADVHSEGAIGQAALQKVSTTEAQVLVIADATVRNAQTPEGEARQYRMNLSMERADDRWLVSKLEFVP